MPPNLPLSLATLLVFCAAAPAQITYVDADFGTNTRHGIYRTIPTRYDVAGHLYRIRVRLDSATDAAGGRHRVASAQWNSARGSVTFCRAQSSAMALAVKISAFIAVSDLARKKKLYMRDAAYIIAIDRVAQACRQRGWI